MTELELLSLIKALTIEVDSMISDPSHVSAHTTEFMLINLTKIVTWLALRQLAMEGDNK